MDSLPEGWENIVLKVVMAALVVVLAVVVWRALNKLLKGPEDSADDRKSSLTIFKNILRVIIWAWAICAVADICFNVDLAGIIGALGVVGIAVSLGAQQTIANIIGGIIVSLSSTMNAGDWITVQGHKEGKLIDTNWRCTMLEDEDGVQFAVPNSAMVSAVIDVGYPYYSIVIPFALKPSTPDLAGLLRECEQTLLDAQIANGTDYEGKRPKAHLNGSALGAIQAEVKVYANRGFDTRSAKREIVPALYDLLQEKGVLAEVPVA